MIKEWHFLVLMICWRMVGQAWFAYHTPPFEKFDEYSHYEYARFIAHQHRLPTADDRPPLPAGWEIFNQFDQPPLTYSLLAPIVAVMDGGGAMNVYAAPPPTCPPAQTHQFLHLRQNRHWLYGVWGARLFMMLLGGLTVWGIWRAARAVFPDDAMIARLAALLFALMPAGVELSTWVNNDAPLMLWGAVTVYGLARWESSGGKLTAWAGLGCALLTKLNGLALLPVLIVMSLRHLKHWSMAGGIGLLILIGTYNTLQCGGAVCRIHRASLPFENWGGFRATLQNEYFQTGLGQLILSASVPTLSPNYPAAPIQVGITWGVLSLGLLSSLRRFSHQTLILWLVVLGAFLLALARVWWLQVGYMPLRYIASALPALVILAASGYRSWGRGVSVVCLGWWGFLLLSSPLLYYRPLFISDPPLTHLPAEAIAMEAESTATGLRLLGYQEQEQELILYFSADRPQKEVVWIEVMLWDEVSQYKGGCGQLLGDAFHLPPDWDPQNIMIQRMKLANLPESSTLSLSFYLLENQYALVNSALLDTHYEQSQSLTLRRY